MPTRQKNENLFRLISTNRLIPVDRYILQKAILVASSGRLLSSAEYPVMKEVSIPFPIYLLIAGKGMSPVLPSYLEITKYIWKDILTLFI